MDVAAGGKLPSAWPDFIEILSTKLQKRQNSLTIYLRGRDCCMLRHMEKGDDLATGSVSADKGFLGIK